jgi:hypothetical protein
VERLIKRNLPVKERIKAVDELLEAYVAQVGEVPDSVQLNRLADYILREDLQNRHPDKVTNTAYPILSEGQQKLRGRREKPVDPSRLTGYRLNGKRKKILGSRDDY